MRTGKEVAFAQTEQEPGVDLQSTVTILAGGVAAHIILIGTVTDAVKVFLCVFITELSENTETVALKEKLRLGEQVESAIEHQGNGYGHYRALLGGVAGIHPEGHQPAAANQQTEIGSVAGTSENIVVEVTAGHPLTS